jgi:hypothetical protein
MGFELNLKIKLTTPPQPFNPLLWVRWVKQTQSEGNKLKNKIK